MKASDPLLLDLQLHSSPVVSVNVAFQFGHQQVLTRVKKLSPSLCEASSRQKVSSIALIRYLYLNKAIQPEPSGRLTERGPIRSRIS